MIKSSPCCQNCGQMGELKSAQTLIAVIFPVKRKAPSVCKASNGLDDAPHSSAGDVVKISQLLKGNILSLVRLKKADHRFCFLLSVTEKDPVILLLIFFMVRGV